MTLEELQEAILVVLEKLDIQISTNGVARINTIRGINGLSQEVVDFDDLETKLKIQKAVDLDNLDIKN